MLACALGKPTPGHLMELRHLRYFVAVARERHFRRAAENLGISQPPLSQQIRALEDELGVQLLLRSGRRVELTSAGTVFLARAERLLDAVEQAVADARRAQQGMLGKLAVGFIGSAAYSILPWILSSFRARVPDVELELVQLGTAEQVRALNEGRIDVAIVRPPVGDARLTVQTVYSEKFVVAMRTSHRLATQRKVALRALAGEDFILFPPQPGMMFFNMVHALCERAGFVPRVVQTATPMQTVIGLVSAGIGITIVPQSVRQVHAPDVVYLDVADRRARADIALAWRKSDASDVLRVFVGIARSTAAQRMKQRD
jgi:DNA-binding transcriptional LysR family regulator